MVSLVLKLQIDFLYCRLHLYPLLSLEIKLRLKYGYKFLCNTLFKKLGKQPAKVVLPFKVLEEKLQAVLE